MVLPFYESEELIYHHACQENAPEKLFVQHTHKMYEVYFFVSGAGKFAIENTLYTLQPGDVMLLRPEEYHQFIPTSPEAYERGCVHFDASLVADCPHLLNAFTHREKGKQNLLRLDKEVFDSLLARMDEAVQMPEDLRPDMLRFVIGEMLTYIAISVRNRDRLVGGHQMPALVETMLQYIHEHLTDPLSLDILSEQVFMTKSHISRVFKAAMGITPMEYIIRKRVQLARLCLREGMNAKSAAEYCGFGDYSSFYRSYRRIIGETPRKIGKEEDHEGITMASTREV